MAKLPISQIRVRSRYSKNLGDIESLAANIKELSLLHRHDDAAEAKTGMVLGSEGGFATRRL